MLRHLGHRAGIKPVKSAVRFAAAEGIECLTLFAFSSENFLRPDEEVSRLMRLFLEALGKEVAELHENNVRLSFIGARERLSDVLQREIAKAEGVTAKNRGLRLNVAVAYGGRWDVVNAVKRAALAGFPPEQLTEEKLSEFVELADCPEPDLLIRTGGEIRISNFLLWQLAYSELYFVDTLWPDFDDAIFADAMRYYAGRQRRIGRTGEQVRSA